MEKPTDDLSAQVETLKIEISKLNSRRFFWMQDTVLRLLSFQFLRGMAFGLGSVVGATIIVSILAIMLSKIDFIPIIGEWAKEIAKQIGPVN